MAEEYRKQLSACGVLLVLAASLHTSISGAREPIVLEVAAPKGPADGRTYVHAIAFSPKDNVLAAFRDGELSLWDVSAAAEKRLVKRIDVPDSRTGRHYIGPLAFSPNGDLVAMPSDSNAMRGAGDAIQVWDVSEGRVIGTLRGAEYHNNAFAYYVFMPDGKRLAVSLGGQIEIWIPTTGERKVLARADSLEGYAIQHMRLLEDGKSLVTVRADGRICVWDTDKLALKAFRNIKTSMYFVGPGGAGGVVALHQIVVSPEAKRAVVVDEIVPRTSSGHFLALWDVEKQRTVQKLPFGRGKQITSVDWSRDGAVVAWTSHSMEAKGTSEIVVWDVEKKKEVFREPLPQGRGVHETLIISPDRRMIAMPGRTLDNQGRVLVWDISDLSKNEPSRAESKGKASDK